MAAPTAAGPSFLARAARRLLLRLDPQLRQELALLAYCRTHLGAGECDPGSEAARFVPTERLTGPGLDWAPSAGVTRLQRWRVAHAEVFRLLRADPRINTECRGQVCLHNGMYGTPDGEIYAAMILDLAPRHIVEIGAGFSTLIARLAVDTLPHGCRLTVIDPEPRIDVAGAADAVVRGRVEDGALEPFLDQEGLLLFIDSSHIARFGGDVTYLYTSALPRLRDGTAVQIHDIFLPWDYPSEYRRRLYTEQYLVQTLLAQNARYQILFATHWMSRERPREMQATFGEVVGQAALFYGASLWLQVRAGGARGSDVR